MPGVRNPREPESPRVIEPTPTISPTPTATPTPTLSRVGGIPTGYTMLYLMHPKARPAVERQIEALIRANLQEIYLGALVDGTFGLDFEYLQNVIRRLATGDHAITLVLFFSNGSAMRDYNRTAASVAFNLVPPDAFRLLIQFDEGTRLQFQQMVSRAIPAFDLNTALNPASRNIAIPMLEDNLDVTSYQSMRELMTAVLRGRADIMRNPCPGCATGNDSNSLGDGVESHNPGGLAALTLRDGFSLDGSGYELPGDAPNQQLSLDSVRDLKAFAGAASLRYFGLWRKQRQGLGTTLIDPDARTYEVPTDEQLLIEVDLLRWGLESLFPTATPTETPED